ncbi:MAG TPA: ribosome maturation factor RimM [Trichocoleus sp.]|jgi:16S rRNA processing protein RimM
MAESEAWLEIGKIVSPQGLKGEVRVYPNSDFPQRFEEPGKRWLLRSGAKEPEVLELVSGRYLNGKGLYVVKFAGITNCDQAEQLRNALMLIPESDRPQLEEGEFHVRDLLDLIVVDQASQETIGVVVDVLSAGNDLLQVKLQAADPDQPETVLIPFVEAIVPVVDLQQRRIEITPPPGLLDLKR